MILTDLSTAKTALNQAKSGKNWTPISGKFWTPIDSPLHFSEDTVNRIVALSGGYPYFIQFISREVYDVWIAKIRTGEVLSVPESDIVRKLDNDFFQARWARATDRQRELLQVIATLQSCENKFTVLEVVNTAKQMLETPFTASHINQMLIKLSDAGLIYKNRFGKYSLAVPLLSQFIKRQATESAKLKFPHNLP